MALDAHVAALVLATGCPHQRRRDADSTVRRLLACGCPLCGRRTRFDSEDAMRRPAIVQLRGSQLSGRYVAGCHRCCELLASAIAWRRRFIDLVDPRDCLQSMLAKGLSERGYVCGGPDDPRASTPDRVFYVSLMQGGALPDLAMMLRPILDACGDRLVFHLRAGEALGTVDEYGNAVSDVMFISFRTSNFVEGRW